MRFSGNPTRREDYAVGKNKALDACPSVTRLTGESAELAAIALAGPLDWRPTAFVILRLLGSIRRARLENPSACASTRQGQRRRVLTLEPTSPADLSVPVVGQTNRERVASAEVDRA